MRDDHERMLDIVEAADRVRELVSRGKPSYDNDAVVQDAMVRRVEIIGEAVSKITPESRNRHSNVPWRDVVALRNRVAHGYFDIDLELIWQIAEQSVPALAAHVQRILDETS